MFRLSILVCMMKINLSKSDLKIIEEHSINGLPNESCGILLGKIREDSLEVEEVITAENELSAPTTFKINPEFVCGKIDEAEEKGLELVGFYHSHPKIPAYVSPRDMTFMSLWPKVVWLIVSVNEDGIKDMKAFVMEESVEEGKSREIGINVD